MRKKLLIIGLILSIVISPIASVSAAVSTTDLDEVIDTTDTRPTLNYEEAIELAYKNSTKLKDLAREIEITKEKRDQANQMFNATIPMAQVGGSAGHAALFAMVNTFHAVDRQLQINQKNYEMEQEKIAYSVETTINNLAKARNDLALANDNLKLTEQELNIAKLKSELKLVSAFDLLSADQAYQAARESYKGKQTNLANKELELYKLTKIDNISSYELDIDNTYTSVDGREIDVDLLATRIKTTAPTVFIYEQLRFLAQQAVDSYTYNQNTLDTYEVKKLELEQAQADLANHKQTMSDAVRSIYLGIQELEAGYEELLINEAKLEAGIANTKLMVDQGMLARIELTKLENNMLGLQNQKYALELQHQELIHTLYKPWVMQGGQ